MRPLKLLRVIAAATLLATASLAATLGTVSAYGAADHPLAQLAFSGNCDNVGFPLCAPPPAGFGTGGIWIWTEIDTGGSADFTGAGCGHVVGGVGGPGGAGGGPFKGTATWWYSTGVPAGAFAVGTDPDNHYYIVQYDPHDLFAYPVTTGHYGWHPVPGVSLQATVAP